MNLYLRLIWILLRVFFARKKNSILAESVLQFRALPTDCDINLHITNSRYLSFMDLGRTYLIGQLRLLPQLYKRRWAPVIHATEVTYLKPIMIGKKFTLVTRLIYWDEKYFYMEQRFRVREQLYAIATVRGLFIGRQGKIPTSEIITLFDDKIASPVLPTFIQYWQEMLEVKKKP